MPLTPAYRGRRLRGIVSFNKLFRQYLPCQPARSCVEGKALPGGMAIEIEAIVSMK